MTYLFGSVANLVKRGTLGPLVAGATIDLAVYEAANAVWKECHMPRRIPEGVAAERIELLAEVFSAIRVRSLEDLGEPGRVLAEILGLAAGEGLTVYDASYVYAARAKPWQLHPPPGPRPG